MNQRRKQKTRNAAVIAATALRAISPQTLRVVGGACSDRQIAQQLFGWARMIEALREGEFDQNPPWTPLVAVKFGATEEEHREKCKMLNTDAAYRNSRYEVMAKRMEPTRKGVCDFCKATDVVLLGTLRFDPDQYVCAVCLVDPRVEAVDLAIIQLSIKRLDKDVAHDFRDMQRIKTEIVGAEREAVELFPAESRLVDMANQTHLWVLPEGMKMPFGYGGRMILEVDDYGARQRPFEDPALKAEAAENLRKLQAGEIEGSDALFMMHPMHRAARLRENK